MSSALTQLNKTRRYSRHTYGDNGVRGKRNIVSVSFVATDLGAPAAAASGGIHSAIATTSSGITLVTTGITQPDVPRNISITPGGTTTDVAAMSITVTGTNVEGAVITDTFTFAADATGAQIGTKAFKTITSISIPAQDGNGATFTVNTSTRLGIGMRNLASMPIKVLVRASDGTETLENASSSNFSSTVVESNTVITTTALDGVKNFRVYVLNYNWHLNPTNGDPSYGV